MQVVHFSDGAETGEVIGDVTVDKEAVSFEAEGFSAYAIVDGPAAVPMGWSKVRSIAELIEMGSQGLYIGHPDGFYYGNTTVGASKRTGIFKTKPAQSYPPTMLPCTILSRSREPKTRSTHTATPKIRQRNNMFTIKEITVFPLL